MSRIQSYNVMPSPRPTGSGALKILLFPQLLEYHVFYFVTFSCDPIEPVLGSLLQVARVCYCSCHLDGLFLFVIIMCLREARLAPAGLIPTVLRTIACNMSLLTTDVAGDIREVGSPTSCYKSSSWQGYTTSTSSSSRCEGIIWFVLGSLSDTRA